MKKKLLLSLIALLLFAASVTLKPQGVSAAGTAADVVNVATSQIGYYEKASNANLDDKTANRGSANYNKFARDIGVANGQPWCATFVWWCMQTAGVPSDKYPRVTYATRDWFRSRGLWHDRGTYTPKPGDYVAFGSAPDHCGIVWTVSGGSFTTIEGNSSDSVKSNSYTINNAYVMGFGEIQYNAAAQSVDKANPGSPYAIPSGNIGVGSSGDGTRWIQTALNNLIGAGLAVDGVFGNGTKNAVIRFQSSNGLTADGIVGNDTRNKMIAVWTSKQDTTKPVISNVKITDKSSIGYTVECDVSDNVGVTKVQFPSWTTKRVNGTDQDDLQWVNGTISNGHAKATINIADHNNEAGPYITHVYAWDAANNQAMTGAGTIYLPQITNGILQNLGDSFTAKITHTASQVLTQSDNKIIRTASLENNKAQQWEFTRNNDGTYCIKNLGNQQYIDLTSNLDANASIIRTYTFNGSNAQKWYIYKIFTGYYFVPKDSKYRVMDIASSSGQTHLWVFNDTNTSQIFGLSMLDKNNPTSTPIVKETDAPVAKTLPPVGTVTPAPVKTLPPVETVTPAPVKTLPPVETVTPTPHPVLNFVSGILEQIKQPTETMKPKNTEEPTEISDETEEPEEIEQPYRPTKHYNEVKKPSRVTGISVKNNGKRKLLVRWKMATGVSGYQVQYALDKKFTKSSKMKKVGSTCTEKTLKGLKKGKKYYVRIRAYKKSAGKTVYGSWSKIRSTKIKK